MAESEMREELLKRVREEMKSQNIIEEISAKSEEKRIKRNLLERVKKELEKDPVIIERKVDWSALATGCQEVNSPKKVNLDFSGVPTWALIEELKKRPGVVYRANATDKGLVGWFEHAPAIILGVKLPVNDEV
jgi:hypothetical protein